MKVVTILNDLLCPIVPNSNYENHDCTDFPKRPCRICGSTSKPQYDGICNDGVCENNQ